MIEVGDDELRVPLDGLTCSHPPPAAPCWIDVVKLELIGPVIVSVWGAGRAPPCASVKLCVPPGVIVTELIDVMFRVMGIVSVLFKSPGDVI
jgi:hypothetical protein